MQTTQDKINEIRRKLKSKWDSIKRRCYNKNDKSYVRYGAKGIKAEWNSFEEFFKDMSESYFEGASIDRIDNTKGYSKDNCQWIRLSEQSRNRRVIGRNIKISVQI